MINNKRILIFPTILIGGIIFLTINDMGGLRWYKLYTKRSQIKKLILRGDLSWVGELECLLRFRRYITSRPLEQEAMGKRTNMPTKDLQRDF